MTVVPVTPTPNDGDVKAPPLWSVEGEGRYSRLRTVFDVGTALLLADAGYDVIGWAPVQDVGVPL